LGLVAHGVRATRLQGCGKRDGPVSVVIGSSAPRHIMPMGLMIS
jgi:hypothetical protein